MNTESERWAKLEDNMVTRSMIRSKSQCQENGKPLQVILKNKLLSKEDMIGTKNIFSNGKFGEKKSPHSEIS